MALGDTSVLDDTRPGLSQWPTTGQDQPNAQDFDRDFWLTNLRDAVRERSATMGAIADQALRRYPTSGEILLTAALAALLDKVPSRAQVCESAGRLTPHRPPRLTPPIGA